MDVELDVSAVEELRVISAEHSRKLFQELQVLVHYAGVFGGGRIEVPVAAEIPAYGEASVERTVVTVRLDEGTRGVGHRHRAGYVDGGANAAHDLSIDARCAAQKHLDAGGQGERMVEDELSALKAQPSQQALTRLQGEP